MIEAELTDITLNAYIQMLVELRNANPGSGLWPVEKIRPGQGRGTARPPVVAYRLEKKSSNGHGGTRVVVGNFWSQYDPPEDKGTAVIRV